MYFLSYAKLLHKQFEFIKKMKQSVIFQLVKGQKNTP